MTREEAAIIIKAIGKHAIETHLTDPGDILDATVMAVQALVPEPDEVTGLMPCGCGGRATRSFSSIGCVVFCASCGLSTKNTFFASEAVNAWNVAMGYKGGAE